LDAWRSIDGCGISEKKHVGHTPLKESVSISANLLCMSLLGREKESVGAAEYAARGWVLRGQGRVVLLFRDSDH